MKKNVKNKPEAAKTASGKNTVPEKSDSNKKKLKAAEVIENKNKKGKNTSTAPAIKESKQAEPKKLTVAKELSVPKKQAEPKKLAVLKKPAARKETVKKKGTAKKAKTFKPGPKETKPASHKAIVPVKETAPVISEEREMKMEVFFYDLTSLQKTRTDPKGTMLIAKFKQHEIGIHADPKLSNLMFSYYPKHGNGEMVNIPISIKDIISFISQKA